MVAGAEAAAAAVPAPDYRSSLDVSATRHNIVFTPSGRRGEFAAGTSVLHAARKLGVDLDSICGGRGICGRCQITAEGNGLTDLSRTERDYAERRNLEPGRRLGCAALIEGPCHIDVPPESQVHRPVVRKTLEERPVNVDPVIRLCYLEVPESDLGDSTGEAAKVSALLATDWQIDDARWQLVALQMLWLPSTNP